MKSTECSLLFLLDGDRILLAMKKRGFGADRFNGVGGKIDPGETPEQAAMRECQEEIGVMPKNIQKVAEHDFVADTDEPWRMYVHVYITTEWDGEPIETEEMRPEWFDLANIPYKQMWEDDAYWLPQVLAGKKLICNFTFDKNDKMLTQNVHEVEVF